MNLTNEQIARVFAMYLGVQCSYKWHEDEILGRVSGSVIGRMDTSEHSEFKLLLKPLSAITDEDAIEVAKMSARRRGDESWLTIGQAIVANISSGRGHHYNIYDHLQCYQYLIQQGYAVPLFIAPNHPANGKTAIELGLATEQ